MNTRIFVALVISVAAIGMAFWLVSARQGADNGESPPTAVIIDGMQIIDITAKGGYAPRVVLAKADVPTVVRVTTSGTFDCSASLVVPALSYQKFLQPSGIEDIAISAEQAVGTLQGLCLMGMYGFQIKFQ